MRLTALAATVLGCDPIPIGATLFDKSEDANWLVPWHQDTVLPVSERREAEGWGPWSIKAGVTYARAPSDVLSKVVALRVHLDECRADNGPLQVLPGTHTAGVLTDHQILSAIRRVDPVVCTVGKGGVLLMRPLVIHSSSKMSAAGSRRVLHFTDSATREPAPGVYLRADG